MQNPADSKSNFVNEIIWSYKTGGASKNSFAKKHDSILFYAKNFREKQFFAKKEKSYNIDGRPYKSDRVAEYKDAKGYYTMAYQRDVWDDVPVLNSMSKERVGYPTQKPISLLNKIIKATTKKGDIVADFFCGCGTAIVAAQRLERKWIGMDASRTACKVMLKRIKEDAPFFNYDIVSKPMTGQDFKKLTAFEFEKAAVRYIGGVTNHAQVGDGGIDGRMAFDGAPIQVKKSNQLIEDDDRFRGFYLPLKQHGRGYYISLHGYTKKAKERASSWRREGLDIQLLSIQDLIAGKWRESRKQIQAKQEAFFKDRYPLKNGA